VAIKTHDELNQDLIGSRDSTHHMLSRTDRQLIVIHQLLYYQAPMGLANKVWQQKLFAFTGNVVGSQMPQTVNTQALQMLMRPVRVSLLIDQVIAIMHDTVEKLPTMTVGAAAGTYDDIQTRCTRYMCLANIYPC
jgi:hypothetical protein